MVEKDFMIKDDNYVLRLRKYVGTDTVVQIPEGVEEISDFAFAEDYAPNSSIEKIILPESITDFNKNTFAFCKSLKEIVFSDSDEITHLLLNFEGCNSLATFSIPETVTTLIGLYCPLNLNTINIPDTLTCVSPNAIHYIGYEGKSDEEITARVLLQNPVYKIIDGFMVNTKLSTTLYRTKDDSDVIRIPDGIEVIGERTFDESNPFLDEDTFEPVVKIIIPATVKKICSEAISNCDSLKEIVYEGNSTDIIIEDNAIYECKVFSSGYNHIKCKDSKEAGKRMTYPMLERLGFIHSLIASGTYPNCNTIQAQCLKRLREQASTLSISTILRDIERLTDTFRAPIEYDKSRKGYYYTEPFDLDLTNYQ